MVLAYLNRGQFFGEMGLFYEQPTRSAWVRTRNQCELAEMTYPRARTGCACGPRRSEEHTSELQSRSDLVCRLLLEKKKNRDLSSRSDVARKMLPDPEIGELAGQKEL